MLTWIFMGLVVVHQSMPAVAPAVVAGPPAAFFANQPVGGGWTEIDDYDWSDPIPVPAGAVNADWDSEFVGQGTNPNGMVELVTDQTDDPVSPNTAVMTSLPIGNYQGDGVGTLVRGVSTFNDIYWGIAAKWDPTFEHNTTSTKLLSVRSGSDTVLLEYNSFGTFLVLWDGSEFAWINVGLPLGQYLIIELLISAVTDTYEVWVDGVSKYSGSHAFAGNWNLLQIESTMGGADQTKDRDSFRWHSHTRISVK